MTVIDLPPGVNPRAREPLLYFNLSHIAETTPNRSRARTRANALTIPLLKQTNLPSHHGILTTRRALTSITRPAGCGGNLGGGFPTATSGWSAGFCFVPIECRASRVTTLGDEGICFKHQITVRMKHAAQLLHDFLPGRKIAVASNPIPEGSLLPALAVLPSPVFQAP
jgi:hypothetical protein